MSEDFTEFAKINQRIGRVKLKQEILKIFWQNPKKKTDGQVLDEIYELLKVIK